MGRSSNATSQTLPTEESQSAMQDTNYKDTWCVQKTFLPLIN